MTHLADLPLQEMPVAVIDLETTGFIPGIDRIVEIAVVWLDPGKGPTLVLDTLVNPKRPISGTGVHDLLDDDVMDAPTFEEVSRELASVLEGRLIASYNVSFDIAFLERAL